MSSCPIGAVFELWERESERASELRINYLLCYLLNKREEEGSRISPNFLAKSTRSQNVGKMVISAKSHHGYTAMYTIQGVPEKSVFSIGVPRNPLLPNFIMGSNRGHVSWRKHICLGKRRCDITTPITSPLLKCWLVSEICAAVFTIFKNGK